LPYNTDKLNEQIRQISEESAASKGILIKKGFNIDDAVIQKLGMLIGQLIAQINQKDKEIEELKKAKKK